MISKWHDGGFTGLISFKLEIEIILLYLLIYFNPLGIRLILASVMIYLIYSIVSDTFIHDQIPISRKFAFRFVLPTNNRITLFFIHLAIYFSLLLTTLFRQRKKTLMKQLISLIGFLIITGFASAADNFTVQWNFINVIDGYDHDNKIQVFIDGKLQAESEVFKQTKVGKVSMTVTPGSHQIRIVDLALYEGKWEEHSIENDYSIDANYEAEHNFKKKSNTLKIVWDIDVTNTDFTWGGSGKAPKSDGKSIPVTVSWEFKGIESGYDHKCRMVVYVNGKQVQVSNTALESEGGNMVVMLPKGNISLKIMNEAFYEGGWEEHTIANNYSVDCFLIGDFTINKQKKVHLIFDINAMETNVTWK